MCNMIYVLATYENPENVVIIHTMAKITIFADIIFAIMLLIARSKIKKEFKSDSFWAPVKIEVLYMSFDRFLLAVESCDLSQADKSTI